MKNLVLLITLNSFIITDGFAQNLISNWSFENNMQLNCQDWFDGCGNELTISCDTGFYCFAGFYNQSPSPIPEETWSLALTAGSFPFEEGFAETYITGQSGTRIYRLEYWMKSAPTLSNDNSIGFASIGTITQNEFTASTTLSDTSSIWKQFNFTDTLTTLATDTIAVRLSAGNCDFCINRVYFDFIELTIVDTLTTISDIDPEKARKVFVYPNPAGETITIEIKGSESATHRFTLYSLQGQVITTIEMHNSVLTCESRDIASGIYFYQVHNTPGNEVIGQGKLVIE